MSCGMYVVPNTEFAFDRKLGNIITIEAANVLENLDTDPRTIESILATTPPGLDWEKITTRGREVAVTDSFTDCECSGMTSVEDVQRALAADFPAVIRSFATSLIRFQPDLMRWLVTRELMPIALTLEHDRDIFKREVLITFLFRFPRLRVKTWPSGTPASSLIF